MTDMIPIFKFLDASGQSVGCGTRVELEYWTAEGVFEGITLGVIIGREPAAMDDQRRAAWAKAA